MNHLILVKHARPEVRPDVPAAQWGLSAAGREAAVALAARLEPYAPFAVFSSPEPKAVQTAQAVCGHLGVGLRTRAGLREHDRDGVPLLSADEFISGVTRCLRSPDALVFGSETATQALDRFAGAVHAILETAQGESVVVVAHGTVISLFVGRCMGVDPLPIWQQLGLPSYVVMSVPDLTEMEIVANVG